MTCAFKQLDRWSLASTQRHLQPSFTSGRPAGSWHCWHWTCWVCVDAVAHSLSTDKVRLSAQSSVRERDSRDESRVQHCKIHVKRCRIQGMCAVVTVVSVEYSTLQYTWPFIRLRRAASARAVACFVCTIKPMEQQ